MKYRSKTQIKHQLLKKMKTQKSQGKRLSQTIAKTSNTNDDEKHQINELEEEIRRLKTTKKIRTDTKNIDQTKISNPLQEIQKMEIWPLQRTKASKKTTTY